MPSGGGPVQAVEGVGRSDSFGGAWGEDDTILYSRGTDALYQAPAAGGTATPATRLDESNGDTWHRWPQFLPDGLHFLFLVRAPNRGVYAGSIDGKTRKLLIRSETAARYAQQGYLLYVDGDSLLVRAFDAKRLELTGEPFNVADRVGRSAASEGAVSVSSSGALAYSETLLRPGRLTWFDRSGNALGTVGEEGDYPDFRLSPDDKRLAATLFDPKKNTLDVWLNELAEGRSSRLSDAPPFNATPLWSPDGARIIYRSSPTSDRRDRSACSHRVSQ